jgi:hypothetical protein
MFGNIRLNPERTGISHQQEAYNSKREEMSQSTRAAR